MSTSRSLFRVTVAGVELAVQVRGDGIPPVLFIQGVVLKFESLKFFGAWSLGF